MFECDACSEPLLPSFVGGGGPKEVTSSVSTQLLSCDAGKWEKPRIQAGGLSLASSLLL